MSYRVKACATPSHATEFYTFGVGCRVSGGSLERRENLVHIPFADGTKDIGDGTLGAGTVTVSGRLWASTGPAALALIDTMETTLLGHDTDFYIGPDYGSPDKFYPVHGCRSITHTMVEGTGGLWIDIECVFSRGPEPAMI